MSKITLRILKIFGKTLEKSEVQLSYPMEDFILNGQVDMIKGKGDTVEIVDFKTGDKPEPSDEAFINYKKQLQVYARLVEAKENVTVSKLKLYYPSNQENPIIEFEKDSQQIDSIIRKFTNVVYKIEKKEFNQRTTNYSVCRECDMRYYCNRIKPK
ncbi:PD-(D/E)XK nuclease family protein [Staphylococcus pseudintermedius]|uniref:PD-(D/E)XK nuclease family protein n=1 Tax=Staphylococcus pseudintermedius TaxID=283734 RepID=UPI0038577452